MPLIWTAAAPHLLTFTRPVVDKVAIKFYGHSELER